MDDLWPTTPPNEKTPVSKINQPLAARLRPQTLDDIIGQDHLLGEGKLLRRAIKADQFSSFIFHGPPGTGKTTLAKVISLETGARFESLNATEANTSSIREKVDQARSWLKLRNQKTILFIDELHRFSKNQQDLLLPHLEDGTIRFIGATTENPLYTLNNALLSRSHLFQLESISEKSLESLCYSAINNPKAFSKHPVTLENKAAEHLAKKSSGDARKCLSALDLAITTTPPNKDGVIEITYEVAAESIQQKSCLYDAKGDAHYDTTSALIKSIRGSDPDAALYWLATMLHSGEDPRFIGRRLIISASEDIGLADSNALRVCLDAFKAYEIVGMPEGRIPLAHATVYLATAPKSNTAYMGVNLALQDVKEGKTLDVPLHLRTKSRKALAKSAGAQEEALHYHYAHDDAEGYIPQSYLPEGRSYYHPSENGLERRIKERLDYWKQRFNAERS